MSLTCCIKSHCTPATLAPAHTPCLFSIDLHTVRQHLVIVHFLLLPLLSGTLFQMISGVPYHSHHLSLVWRHTCFVQFTLTRLFWLTVILCLLTHRLFISFFLFPSCTVLLICLCSHRCCCFVLFFKIFFYERAWALRRNVKSTVCLVSDWWSKWIS